MDIDKMFKLPALPAGGSLKRKMTHAPTPDQLKRFRTAEESKTPSSSVPFTTANESNRGARVSDEEDEDVTYAAGDLPDEEDADDDGRFFGGGLNDEQEQILDIFEKAVDEGASSMTIPVLRRQLTRFERTVARNAEQRGKYADDPSRFIESESDLDASLKSFLPLTQNPPMFYPELIKSGSIALLTNLLSHENTDIAIDVIEVVQELTDEDVGAEVDDMAGEERGEGSMGEVRRVMGDLIDELLNNSLLDLLVANLTRMNEAESTDSQGVFAILGVFENLLSFLPPIALQLVTETKLLPWLLERIQRKQYDSNKQYSSEILAILMQGGRDVILRVWEADGVEVILKALSQYRKKDPADSEEVEFMENLFNCLSCGLGEPQVKQAFLDAEGVELMIIMMREKLLARTRALAVIDHATQTEAGTEACERFVSVGGLKPFFSIFMGKNEQKKKSPHSTAARDDEDHLVSTLSSLFCNLPSDSSNRIRVVMKFVEGEYEKVERLLEIRDRALAGLRGIDKEIEKERQIITANNEEATDDEEDDWYLRRMEAGLATLQGVDFVLAWVCMEDDGARSHAQKLMARKDQSVHHISDTLAELRSTLGEVQDGEAEVDEAEQNRIVILDGLITFLRGCE